MFGLLKKFTVSVLIVGLVLVGFSVSAHAAFPDKPITVYGRGKQTRSFCYYSDLIDGIVGPIVTGIVNCPYARALAP